LRHGTENMVNRGWYGRQSVNRWGRNQRAVWRALIGHGRPMTTAELLAFVYPRLTRADIDAGGSLPHNGFASRGI
jgi:hypothetical protein